MDHTSKFNFLPASKSLAFLFMIGLLAFSACKKDDEDPADENGTITLSIDGLEDLGSGYAYEGWLIVNGSPVSTGVFTVNGSGALSQSQFTLAQSDIDQATEFVLTIEPSPDSDPAPAATHILAGGFNGNSAPITVGHGSAIGNDFTAATGDYILATPTDGTTDDENSGIWWLDPAAGPGAGLTLPTLPAGWKYEGWAVINGTPVSTGTFTSNDGMDESAPFSGTTAGPPFPGEDFLVNAPSGLSFPLDLSGMTAVISVEPDPDNSTAPFLLKPLVGNIPAAAVDHTLYSMDNNATATNPTGTVSR